jgi:hypothetical protein
MAWKQLVTTLEHRVPAGSITTHAQVSLCECGVHTSYQPVRSLPRGVANHGHQRPTNHGVGTEGRFRNFPEGLDQQRRQVLDEGVPFTPDGRVDFGRLSLVKLA